MSTAVTPTSAAFASKMVQKLDQIEPESLLAPNPLRHKSLIEMASGVIQGIRAVSAKNGARDKFTSLAMNDPEKIVYGNEDNVVNRYALGYAADCSFSTTDFRVHIGIPKEKFSDSEIAVLKKFTALVYEMTSKPVERSHKQTPTKILYGALQNLG